ncbi:transcriptional regulator, TetR family [Streptosporangium subroseum]|uniref:Transcriptional regulator, TetR family n=2 Tax=Streptosporangium subroseum TaxID=106412 RepID=A0A239DBY5_9ACTN|nr:transcriptional regulator, TetR family [Streptosporangium subroseum]
MVTPMSASRLEQRKAQTRRKLVDAARAMLADGTAQRASIQEITEAADVGFGSFYNHFTSKDALFVAAVADVLEEVGALLERLNRELADPAAGFAQSVRLAVRMARKRPQVAHILVRHGLSYLDGRHGLTPRILPDIIRAVEAGRFTVDNPRLAFATTFGSVLGTLQLTLVDPDFAAQPVDEQLAEQLLRMFGVAAGEARELATGPLPDLP